MSKEFLTILFSSLKKASIPGALVISYKNTSSGYKFLLVKLRNSERVFFPSGNLEWGENFEKAARREFFEETGLTPCSLKELTFIHAFKYRNLPIKFRSYQKVYLAVPSGGKPQPREYTIEWARWFGKDEVMKLLSHPELRSTFKRALRFLSSSEK